MTTTYDIANPARPNGAGASTVEVRIALDSPQTRIAVRAPEGTVGRAEALLGQRIWAAKHYWIEGPQDPSGAQTTVFEFDEALPAGQVLLRIPFTPKL